MFTYVQTYTGALNVSIKTNDMKKKSGSVLSVTSITQYLMSSISFSGQTIHFITFIFIVKIFINMLPYL